MNPPGPLIDIQAFSQCSCPFSALLFCRPKPCWHLWASLPPPPSLGILQDLLRPVFFALWLETPSPNWNNYWLIICYSGNPEEHGSMFFITIWPLYWKLLICKVFNYFLFPLEQLNLVPVTLPCMGADVSGVVLAY